MFLADSAIFNYLLWCHLSYRAKNRAVEQPSLFWLARNDLGEVFFECVGSQMCRNNNSVIMQSISCLFVRAVWGNDKSPKGKDRELYVLAYALAGWEGHRCLGCLSSLNACMIAWYPLSMAAVSNIVSWGLAEDAHREHVIETDFLFVIVSIVFGKENRSTWKYICSNILLPSNPGSVKIVCHEFLTKSFDPRILQILKVLFKNSD